MRVFEESESSTTRTTLRAAVFYAKYGGEISYCFPKIRVALAIAGTGGNMSTTNNYRAGDY